MQLGLTLDAFEASIEAVLHDESNEKSRLLRAKSNYQAVREGILDSMDMKDPTLAAQIIDDLNVVIRANGNGKAEAQTLLDEVNADLQSHIEKHAGSR